eukprot:3444873-Rhodomonas_salina.1
MMRTGGSDWPPTRTGGPPRTGQSSSSLSQSAPSLPPSLPSSRHETSAITLVVTFMLMTSYLPNRLPSLSSWSCTDLAYLRA